MSAKDLSGMTSFIPEYITISELYIYSENINCEIYMRLDLVTQ